MPHGYLLAVYFLWLVRCCFSLGGGGGIIAGSGCDWGATMTTEGKDCSAVPIHVQLRPIIPCSTLTSMRGSTS